MSMLTRSPHPALPQRGKEFDGRLRGLDLIAALEGQNLLGRGGAGFPLARKWRTVKANGAGRAVVLANGAEGEPLSRKDRTLMVERPHLVIDGAMLAAEAVQASDIIFYVGSEHREAVSVMRRALGERQERAAQRARLVEAPPGYISGEESAAVHHVNAGDARPTTTPPRPFERGVDGRATLVQNVESLAVAALVAAGDHSVTALLTAGGAVRRGGVYELPLGASPADLADAAGGLTRDVQAVLIGGYFGSWACADDVWSLPLDPISLRARGLTFGCGVSYFLPIDRCGVDATARIMTYLAGRSARQCGPCVFGLNAIADATRRLAERAPQAVDLERITRWSGLLSGRGACKHPDGATGLLRSALEVFADDFAAHQRRRCIRTHATPCAPRVMAEAVA
jgi:NADH:ubiquinone oxidoreductase subunit F (NADH-binding)